LEATGGGKGEVIMTLRLDEKVVIDNLRNYPAEIVRQLRALLSSGAEATPDPQRKNFYDLENHSRLFYIHICPNGKVLLLAVWSNHTEHVVEPATTAAAPADCR